MAKYNPFDPANGYSEEDRLALNGKCASLINQAYLYTAERRSR